MSDLFQNSSPAALPTPDSIGVTSERALSTLRDACLYGPDSLYILSKVVLGYDKLNDRVHLPMCRFAVETRRPGGRRMMLMPRGHYKTTIWTIADSIQLVCLNPDVQILIVADTGLNAERFMREIQLHFERNHLFRALFAPIVPDNFNKARWNSFEMEVKRKKISRDPTIDAIGALGGSESRHYDVIKSDDLVTEKCIRSDVEMDKTTKWSSGLESLLTNVNEGMIDFIGSRKKKGDTYEVQEKSYSEGHLTVEIGPHAVKKGRLLQFVRQAEEGGSVIFPEVISAEFLARLRKIDPERYHAQYGNSPKAEGINTFNVDDLRYYKWTEDKKLQCIHDGEVLLEVSPWEMERIVLYDPSVAEKKTSSKQAFHVLAKGAGPFRFVLESRVEHIPPNEAIDYLFDLQKRWQPSFFSIEKRGFQGWVKYSLNERAEYEGLPYLTIQEWPPSGDPSAQWMKIEHIRGLQPVFRANYMWLHESMKGLIDDIEFYPNIRFDDGLDALSQGLTYWPLMLSEEEVRGRRRKEESFLQENFGMALLGVTAPEQEAQFDELKWLDSIGADGYSIARA